MSWYSNPSEVKRSKVKDHMSEQIIYSQTDPKWAWSRSRDVLTFWQISVNISKKVQNRDRLYLQWKTNWISYMAYQTAATAVTLNDLQGYSQIASLLKCSLSSIMQHFIRTQLTLCSRCLYVSWTSRMNLETTDKRKVYKVYARNRESG